MSQANISAKLKISAVGIDFGTSNSTVGFLNRGLPELIEVEGDNFTIPSAVFYDFEENQTLFGRRAISAYVEHYEGRLLRSLKSILGSPLIEESTQIANKRISFKEIIGEFLLHLKTSAETKLGKEIENVVLGRPVRFVDQDDAADLAAQEQLRSAASAQGFKNIHFQYEPIAAALDYEQSVNKEELALIVDIGGGTSDFSIVRVSPQRRGKDDRKSDILANSGVHVGGTDIDRRLSISEVMPFLGYKSRIKNKPQMFLPSSPFYDLATWHKIIFMYNNKTLTMLSELRLLAAEPEKVDRMIKIVKQRNGHRLAGDIEAAKIALSEQDQTPMQIDYVEEDLQIILQRAKFELATAPERDKITGQIQQCLADAAIMPSQIDTIFLTGGSTAIPSVFAACKNTVPAARVVTGNRLGSVGTGLAIDAGVRFAS